MKLSKKVVSVFLVIVLAFSSFTVIASTSDDIRVTIDGVAVDFDGQGPVIIDGRTLVPVRGVFEALGFYPTWQRSTQTATLTRDDFVVILTIGSATFTTNGVAHTLDVPAQIIGGRTMLPLRAVLESIGIDDMDWSRSTRTVIIRTPDTPDAEPNAIVGIWAWDALQTWVYVFNADGTGIRGGNILFNWAIAGNILTLCLTPSENNCATSEEWYFTITGNQLELTSRDDEFSYTYIRMPDDAILVTPTPSPDQMYEGHVLLGGWNYLGEHFIEFWADGRGLLVGSPIGWTTVDGVLELCVTPELCRGNCLAPERWFYTVEGNQLTLESHPVRAISFTFERRR